MASAHGPKTQSEPRSTESRIEILILEHVLQKGAIPLAKPVTRWTVKKRSRKRRRLLFPALRAYAMTAVSGALGAISFFYRVLREFAASSFMAKSKKQRVVFRMVRDAVFSCFFA